jgi:hypothetical protein
MTRKLSLLTFELTRGTKTYYLPTQRGPQAPPILTLMLRRRTGAGGDNDLLYSAGMVICSAFDRFERKVGRAGAFERLRWARFRGLEFSNPLDLLEPLMLQVRAALKASPIELPLFDTQDEILGILSKAVETFDQLDQARAELDAKHAKCLAAACEFDDPTGC